MTVPALYLKTSESIIRENMYDAPDFDLDQLLRERRVVTHFQPQVSTRKRAVFGLEALSRGVDENGEFVTPDRLFAAAREQGRLLELDRLCREKACKAFLPHYRQNKTLMLSLNIDASIIGTVRRTCHLRRMVGSMGINPNNVIIEIIESRASSTEALLHFVEHYRDKGFLVALDDVGAGHSNFDRVPLLKPDILKIDRSLVRDADIQFHKSEIIRSFVAMGDRLGSKVLAEGVERTGEVLALMEAGVDAFQGFFFARPSSAPKFEGTEQVFDSLGARYKTLIMERIASRKRVMKTCDELMDTLCAELAGCSDNLNHKLSQFIQRHPALECLYVLDALGTQVSDSICSPEKLNPTRRFLYEPARPGSDHSLKEYYLPLQAGLSRHTTGPYISLASGNRCITVSARLDHPVFGRLILCADVAYIL